MTQEPGLHSICTPSFPKPKITLSNAKSDLVKVIRFPYEHWVTISIFAKLKHVEENF